MKLSKILLSFISVLSLTSCFGDIGGGGGGTADANLYHLTLSSNIQLTDQQKAGLKATYGYGEPSIEVVEGVRGQDEIDELKSAGATDADIEKAGKRQSDGSYYFFDQDPIYLEAPIVTGYKLDGFYDKATNQLADRATVQGPSDNRLRSRWNMFNKNTELEARYVEIAYNITFDTLADDETNPNTMTNYSFLRDGGNVVLEDATTTNKLKTFVCWQYQDLSFDGPNAPWIEIVDGKLPIDYELEDMRISAKFEYKKLKIDFAFKEYIDSETINSLSYDDAIDSMYIKSNLASVDGTDVESGVETIITKTSEIKVDGVSGWVDIFFTLKPEYDVFYFELNGVRNEKINSSHMTPPYVSIRSGDLTEDSTITFVLSLK